MNWVIVARHHSFLTDVYNRNSKQEQYPSASICEHPPSAPDLQNHIGNSFLLSPSASWGGEAEGRVIAWDSPSESPSLVSEGEFCVCKIIPTKGDILPTLRDLFYIVPCFPEICLSKCVK